MVNFSGVLVRSEKSVQSSRSSGPADERTSPSRPGRGSEERSRVVGSPMIAAARRARRPLALSP